MYVDMLEGVAEIGEEMDADMEDEHGEEYQDDEEDQEANDDDRNGGDGNIRYSNLKLVKISYLEILYKK